MYELRLAKKKDIISLRLVQLDATQEWGFAITGHAHIIQARGPIPDVVNEQAFEVEPFDGDDQSGTIAEGWGSSDNALAWLTRHFPTYVKVGDVFYRPDHEVEIDEGPVLSTHPASGVLFYIARTWVDEREHVQYACLDHDPKKLQAIKDAIAGDESDVFYYALVRRSIPTGWKYYPLPLIYASPEERELAAEGIHSTPPPERWVRRRKKAVEKLLTPDT